MALFPRLLHLLYLDFGSSMSAEWADNAREWQRKLREPEERDRSWRVVLWGDAHAWPQDLRGAVRDPRALLDEEPYKPFKDMFYGYKNNIERADIIRYIILHKHGGVYADMDTRPNLSITPLLTLYEQDAAVSTVFASSYIIDGQAANGFIIAHPRSPFLGRVLEEAQARSKTWYISRHVGIMNRTGALLINGLLRERRHSASVKVIPNKIFNTCTSCSNSCKRGALTLVTETHGRSWHRWDSRLIDRVICFFLFTRDMSVTSWAIFIGLLLLAIAFLFRRVMQCKAY